VAEGITSGRVNRIVELPTRPEPPTCEVAIRDWQDRVQTEKPSRR